MEATNVIVGLIAALFGGVGLKIVEHMLSTVGRRDQLAADLRDELREEARDLRSQLAEIDTRIEKWRKRYYNILMAFNELMVLAMSEGLVDEAIKIRERIQDDQDDK